jgi:hypothetical protein
MNSAFFSMHRVSLLKTNTCILSFTAFIHELGSLALAMLKIYQAKLYRIGGKKRASIVLGGFILCAAKS